jgi:hypothetical protein
MSNPQSGSTNTKSAAAQLRENLVTYYEVSDLESLCFDLGVDYSGLPGDGVAAKVVALIEYFARTGRIVELIDRCAQLRPNVAWAGLRTIAINNPAAFLPIVPAVISNGQSGNQLLNLPADRALKLGIALGVLVILLLLCGFSGGLLASKFVAITVNPVPTNPGAGSAAIQELNSLQALPPGHVTRLAYDNVKATSLANALLIGPNSPITEIHIQFLDGGDVAVNARLKALGNRRVVVGFEVHTLNGRVVLVPKAAAIDILGLQGTTFGWVPVPVAFVSSFFTWLQQQLDLAARSFWFDNVSVARDRLVVELHKR